MSPKSKPLTFLIFYNKFDVEKSQRFENFAIFDIVKILKIIISVLKLDFSRTQHPISELFTLLPKSLSLKRSSRRSSRILRYIQSFDVIPEVYCVSVRNKRRFEKIELYPNFYLGPAFFWYYATFFLISFHGSPSRFLLEAKRF